MEKSIAFLLGQEPDANGRTVQQYLQFDENDWEFQHDVIQMAFPTRTQSSFHPGQPFLPTYFNLNSLDSDDQQRCKATVSLLLHSYLKSINVEFLINHTLVTFNSHTLHPDWASSRDHNTLRMTRILECLGIFDMQGIQTALHDFLVYDVVPSNYDRINSKTVVYWSAAKEGKLHLIR